MELKNVKNALITRIIEDLEDINAQREYYMQFQLNIPFFISVLDSELENKYKCILEDISSRGYEYSSFTESKDGISEGYLELHVYEEGYIAIKDQPDKYDGSSDWEHIEFIYKLKFSSFLDHLGCVKPLVEVDKIIQLESSVGSLSEEEMEDYIDNFDKSSFACAE